MKKNLRVFCLMSAVLFVLVSCCPADGAGGDDGAVVRAVLFYSPTCPHCEQVMNEDLPPLESKYGEQLDVLEVNTTTSSGSALFYAALDHFGIPQDQAGVPLMIVGNTLLRGSTEIPQQLPGLIEAGLAVGGVDWPEIPGFAPPE